MVIKVIKYITKLKPLDIFLFIFALIEIGREKSIGWISLMVVVIYLVIKIKNSNAYKISFVFSLVLLCFATALYILDVTGSFYDDIKRLSDWSYVYLTLGSVQLLSTIYQKGKKETTQ